MRKLRQSASIEPQVLQLILAAMGPTATRCRFPVNSNSNGPYLNPDGSAQLLSSLCEYCIQETLHTLPTVPEEQATDAELDLDSFMEAADGDDMTIARQIEQWHVTERERLHQEEMARLHRSRWSDHLDESRRRLGERIHSHVVLQESGRERREHFRPEWWIEEPPEISEASSRRSAHEMIVRHVYSENEEVAFPADESAFPDRTYWGDLSALGSLSHDDRMEMYFKPQPDEPYEEPLAWQMHGCASAAEEEMLMQGYGEGEAASLWQGHWHHTQHDDYESLSVSSAERMLEHLGPLESQVQDDYYDFHLR